MNFITEGNMLQYNKKIGFGLCNKLNLYTNSSIGKMYNILCMSTVFCYLLKAFVPIPDSLEDYIHLELVVKLMETDS